MIRAVSIAVACFGFALLLPVAGLAGEPKGILAGQLDRALGAPALRGARIGALVVALDDGRTLYSRQPDEALVPASNLKVLTALAALSTFGPTHQFETTVLANARPDAAGQVKTLYVYGGGDPALTSEQWWRLAADLRARGLRRISGDVVFDDSRFDRTRWNPAWGAVSSRAYHAPAGALTANYGAFEVWVEPGPSSGAPVSVTVDPPVPYLRVVNRAKTASGGGPVRLAIEREADLASERIVVSGSLPLGRKAKRFARSVSDPARYAGSVFRMQLEAVGIGVGGQMRLGSVPDAAVVLHAFEGLPVGEVVLRFMKWSNNAIGEMLLKGMAVHDTGKTGSTDAGVVVARRKLEALGLDLSSLNLVDGSGLSNRNRVSPRLLDPALRVARSSFDFGPEFVTSLPIAGADGTLRKRAEEVSGSVRAKTGLLNGVTGLSGFARGPSGEQVVFSVLVNGFRSDAGAAMSALDGFAATLVSSAGSGPRTADHAR